MGEIIKSNRHVIGKLILTHLVMTIFGTMVFLPFGNLSASGALFLGCAGAVALIFYIYLIDVDVWYAGAEHKLRADAGKSRPNILAGFAVGFIAALPDIVIGALFVVFQLLFDYYESYPSGIVYQGILSVIQMINLLWSGMYMGIEYALLGTMSCWYHLAVPIIPITFTGIFYALGYSGSSFLKPPSKNNPDKA
ncbi:MAG: hypothetical protein MJ101_01210 [Clostridia bacterium]|nr:hypothetical protein [Clostridia bacterium]